MKDSGYRTAPTQTQARTRYQWWDLIEERSKNQAPNNILVRLLKLTKGMALPPPVAIARHFGRASDGGSEGMCGESQYSDPAPGTTTYLHLQEPAVGCPSMRRALARNVRITIGATAGTFRRA
jgi:hypothetical protein